MNSKREKFYTLCKKLWTAGSAAALATAFFISGSQFTSVAHAQGWTDDYHYTNVDYDRDITFPLSGSDPNLAKTDTAGIVIGGKNVTITDGKEIKSDYGAIWALYSDEPNAGNLLITNQSKITQKYTGSLRGTYLKIDKRSQVTQGINESEIVGDYSLIIDDASVIQGTDGIIVSSNGELFFQNGAKITQDGASSYGTSSQGKGSFIEADKALTITGTGTQVRQGNGSTVRSQTDTVSITSGGQLFQGDGSTVTAAAGKDIVVSGANSKIDQGDSSSVTSGGRVLLSGGATIKQEDNGSVVGQGDVTLTGNATSISQGDNGTLQSNAKLSATDATINQGDVGAIRGNSVELSSAKVNQAKNGSITSNTEMSIAGGTISQEYGQSVITSVEKMTISSGATINQSVNMGGTAANARLSSTSGELAISGSTVKQGDGGSLYGNTGVNVTGSTVIVQGDNSIIETSAGKDIKLSGSVTQGNNSKIETASGGLLSIANGTKIQQGNNARLRNANSANVTFDGTEIRQGNMSLLETGGSLTVTNTGSWKNNIFQGDKSTLAASTVKIDNAGVALGAESKIRIAYTQGNTEAEKEAAAAGLEVTNNSVLNLGGMSSIVSGIYEGGVYKYDSAEAFHKIRIGAGSEIHFSGPSTFNNDWIDITATGLLTSTNGTITLKNESKIYGNGTISSSGLIVTDGSILAPGYGNQLGTLTIEGPLTVTKSGIVEIHANAGGNDRLLVKDYVNIALADIPELGIYQGDEISRESGDVIIAGSKLVSFGFEDDKEYMIIDMQGSNGDFFGEFEVAGWIEAKTWVGNDGNVYVSQRHNGGGGGGDYFAPRADTFNRRSTGRMLDAMINLGSQRWSDTLQPLWALSDAELRVALDTISGGVKANSLTLYRENPWRSALDQFGWNPCGQAILGGQNRFCPNICQKSAVWATPYYTEAEYRSDENAGAYTTRSVGFLAGLNAQLDQRTVLGAYFGYGRPEMSQGRDEVEMDDITVGIVAGGMLTPKVEMKMTVAGGFQNYSMTRNMSSLNEIRGNYRVNPLLRSDFDGNTLFASVELARPMYLNTGVLVRPLVAFESESVWQKGFREQGESIYALNFDKTHNDRTFVRTGLSAEIGARNFSLLGRAFYSYQVGGTAFSQNDARFADGGVFFESIRGVDLQRSFTTLGAGGNFYLNPRKTQTVSANYDATMSAKSTSQAVYASFTQMF